MTMKKAVRRFKETVEFESSILNSIRSHRYFSVTVLVCALLLAACVHIWQRVKVMELVREVSYLKRENASLLDDKKKLCSEIASLSMASRIERYASDSLGMRRVSADRLFTLIPKREKIAERDDLELMFSAIKRVADYVPVVSQARANASGVEDLKLDSLSNGGIGK